MEGSDLPPRPWANIANRYETEYQRALRENANLRAALKDVANALGNAMTTLSSVDPNAPSLETAELVMEKHVRIVAPLIEEARNRKKDDV